jgi:CRISPR/Cas system type I-B associated protein Csh2 (Cas7 group RAMP superfamily)
MFPLIFAFLAFFCELSAELFKRILSNAWSKMGGKISSPRKKRTRHKIIMVRQVEYERKKGKHEKHSSALGSLSKAEENKEDTAKDAELQNQCN